MSPNRLAFILATYAFMTVTLLPGCGPVSLDSTSSTNNDQVDQGDQNDVVAGVLQVRAFTDSLGQTAHLMPSGQSIPDDVDVNLTPRAYTVAFKRIVIKEVDEDTDEVLVEHELFSADSVDEALIVDLLDSLSLDVLEAEDLPDGAYNQVDIEVFYLDMTVATLYPDDESHDITYRMVYEDMGVLEQRDFLLELDPDWMEEGSELAASVTDVGWYWMEMSDPDNVVAVDWTAAHPSFHVLDLFANEEFWSSEHKVLEGGRIDPPLEYDAEVGGIVTIEFDVTGAFNFKDYYDDETEADGLWEIRLDGGIHPFPPVINCVPDAMGEEAS